MWARSLNLDGQTKLKPDGNPTSRKIDFSGRQAIDPGSAHTPPSQVALLHATEQAHAPAAGAPLPRAAQLQIASHHASLAVAPTAPANAHARMCAAGAVGATASDA